MKFEEWLSQQGDLIEVDCGCVTTESFYHWLRAAYESGVLTNEGTLQSCNSAQPVTVPAGYVLVPVEPTPEMLTASYVFAHIDNTADSWKAMLASVPKAPASQLTPAPGWTGNGDANAALVMLDRIDALDPADDDRIEEVKRIIRSLAEPTAPDGWIPVSERVPETYVNVLLTDEHGDTCIGQLECEEDNHFYIAGSIHRYKATHWRPLPDAPKVTP